MKYFGLLAAALLLALPVSNAAAQGMRMTPEQRAGRLKDSLALSDEQVGNIVTIYKDMDQRRQDLFSSGSDDRSARMKAMRSLMDSTDLRIEALLSADQKAKYEDLKKQRQERGQEFRRRPTND